MNKPEFPFEALRAAKSVMRNIAMQSRAAAINCKDDLALKALNVLRAEGIEADIEAIQKFEIQWCNGEFDCVQECAQTPESQETLLETSERK